MNIAARNGSCNVISVLLNNNMPLDSTDDIVESAAENPESGREVMELRP